MSVKKKVLSVDIYSMRDYAKVFVFVSVNSKKVTDTLSITLAIEFLQFTTFNEEQ